MTDQPVKLPTRVKLYRAVANVPQLIVGNEYQVAVWSGQYANLIIGLNTHTPVHFSRLIPPCRPTPDV